MPRFAANLTFLFNEVQFLERFGEAAHAGFRAVEFAFAYEYRIAEIVARQREHRLEVVLINAPSGDWAAGDRGLASLPARAHVRSQPAPCLRRSGEPGRDDHDRADQRPRLPGLSAEHAGAGARDQVRDR